jgi:hypothetical protein
MSSTRNPSIADYESIFGPGARDIKEDPMRNKRNQRWHLPDVLKGPNPYLTDRIDGLITDTTNSPFTSTLMPYKYLEHPDAKIKWNVWSFDEGMANRVPYESAARVLTQSKQSFAGYTVRQGLAITMEHNFMMSDAGRTNFTNQLKQMVGSIQYTNDLDVHVALITAPSYARKISEKYYARDKNVWQRCREYVDLFGVMQKNPNALDLLIEETKATFKSWGSQDPSFLLTNSKLTMQLTMNPERTQYVTQGPDGLKRLADGPNLAKYRGLDVIHSRSFSTETGARPRDLLDRRVRVAEYYVIPDLSLKTMDKCRVQLYDQSKDTMFVLTGGELLQNALLSDEIAALGNQMENMARSQELPSQSGFAKKNASALRTLTSTTTNPHQVCGKDALSRYNIAACAAAQKSAALSDPSGAGVSGARIGADVQCDRWSNVRESAFTSHKDSILKYLSNNNVFSDSRILVENPVFQGDYQSRYTATTGLVHETKVWDLKKDVKVDQARKRFDAWINGVEDHAGNTLPIYVGMVPTNAMIDYLLSPCKDASTEGEKEMRRYAVDNILCPAMGFGMNDMRVGECKFKDTRLFMMTALISSLYTKDVDEFLPLSGYDFGECAGKGAMDMKGICPGDVDFKTWITELMRSHTVDAAMGMQQWKPGAGDKPRHIHTEDTNMSLTNLWAGYSAHHDGADTQGDAIEMVACILRHLINILFSHDDIDHSVLFTLAASKGFCMGRFFEPECYESVTRAFSTGVPSVDVHPGGYVGGVGGIGSGGGGAPAWSMRGVGIDVARSIGNSQAAHTKKQLQGSDDALGLDWRRKLGMTDNDMFPDDLNDQSGNSDTSFIDSLYNNDDAKFDIVMVRPCIEHNMLGVVMGRGGEEDLGATFWGQTELSVYDDGMHGKWGMSYKYHERAIVLNEKNLMRCWDVAFNGYNGGCDDRFVNWEQNDSEFRNACNRLDKPYDGPSIICMVFPHSSKTWSNPVLLSHEGGTHADVGQGDDEGSAYIDPENINSVYDKRMKIFNQNEDWRVRYQKYANEPNFPDLSMMHATRKTAGSSSNDSVTEATSLAFQGTVKIDANGDNNWIHTRGAGHLGDSYVGVASVREGKGFRSDGAPAGVRMV